MAALQFTFDALRELLIYQPDTGKFVARCTTARLTEGVEVGGPHGSGYTLIRLKPYRGFAHRLAFLYMTGAHPQGNVDHINGIRDDNRWCNLRDASQCVNMQNLKGARTDSRTGLLGVAPNGKRWMAMIMANGKRKYLGTYDTPEEAHAAYLHEKRLVHAGCTI